jgi:tetratricopeptide (TPR) repeat protein
MGGNAGYRAYIHRDLETGRTLIALSNCRRAVDGNAMRAIDAVVTGRGDPGLPKVPLATYLGHVIRRQGIEAALRRHDELVAAGDEGFDLGEDQLNLLGYDCLFAGELDLALALFQKNAEVHPNSWNAHDSLGEAYAARGEREKAIEAYSRSLELNPDNANAAARLEEL